ncbi:LCP family protein [Brachybacterium kimchii]|uniref:LCP family protein n=1 Tax=Brachybacterium kimchii TaxID=2942909 RepID=A0ABY4N2U5_9MICO|nr:LCP family protein [Brachybacterium kimchii]UQN28102.1 LCP family protein [Brachybacterium kimchii]
MSDPTDLPEGTGAVSPRRRRWRGVLIALLIVAALVATGGIIVGRYMHSLDSAYQKRTTVSLDKGSSDGDRKAGGSGQNILLLGSDKRSAQDAGSEGVSGQRSDAMMLVHIPADGGEAYIVSFPRDLYIDIPGHGKDRINSALAYGGLPLAVTTVENYTKTPIDHVALIDFDGIEGLVDSLGGVDVNVPESFERGGTTFTAGTQHLNGKEALTFSRERKHLSGGDFARNQNQQQLLKAVAMKLISGDTLSSPGKMRDTVTALSPYLTTDDGLTSQAIVKLGLSNRNLRGSDLHFLAAPHGDPATTSGGASVVASDEKGMDALRTALKEDNMEEYAKQIAD